MLLLGGRAIGQLLDSMVQPRLTMTVFLSFLAVVAPGGGKVSDEHRKIPWAPRVVVERKELAVFLEEKDCGLDVELKFSVQNFRSGP